MTNPFFLKSTSIFLSGLFAATSAFADEPYETNNDGFYAGGHVELEASSDTYGQHRDVRGEALIGWSSGDFQFGVGIHDRLDLTAGDSLTDDIAEQLFFVASLGRFVVSYKPNGTNIYGAGNIVGEDYFEMDDATDNVIPLVRVDYATENFHLAFSQELDDADEWEVGLATAVGGNFVRAGFANETLDFFVMTGRDMGTFEYHVAAMIDFDDGGFDDHIGASLFWDLGPATSVGMNVSYAPSENALQSYGLMAWHELGNGTVLRAEWTAEPWHGYSDIEVGILIPFGKRPPAAYERHTNKEFYRKFGFTAHQHGG